jgi:hypothetical protein
MNSMRGVRLTVLLVAVGLSASPVAGLYCDTQGQATMECCQGDMSECNQPGKTEDCCQVAPTSQEAAAVVGKAPEQTHAFDAVALPGLPTALRPPTAHLRISTVLTPQPDTSPPRTPILRV